MNLHILLVAYCFNLANPSFDCGLMNVAGCEDALFKELWHACAGPLVTVPQQDELVFYFPQGHIEQVIHVLMLNFSGTRVLKCLI